MTSWSDRIVGMTEVSPDDLLANPRNWRVHPAAQQVALEKTLASVGWVAPVIVNIRTGYLVDGHARVMSAMRAGQTTIPVLHVDLSPDEEAAVIATFDPLTGMAVRDEDLYLTLLEDFIPPGDMADVIIEVAASMSETRKIPRKESTDDEDRAALDTETGRCPACGGRCRC